MAAKGLKKSLRREEGERYMYAHRQSGCIHFVLICINSKTQFQGMKSCKICTFFFFLEVGGEKVIESITITLFFKKTKLSWTKVTQTKIWVTSNRNSIPGKRQMCQTIVRLKISLACFPRPPKRVPCTDKAEEGWDLQSTGASALAADRVFFCG